MKRRIFLANVGANASHCFKSPIFPDGTFEILPIPEARNYPGNTLVRYRDLRSFINPASDLLQFVPPRWHDWPCHFDPEFYTNTYGDDCDVAPRAAALKGMQAGDFIFFIVRLTRYEKGNFLNQPGFYLIGYLEIREIVASVTGELTYEMRSIFGDNAHIRRARAEPSLWNRFWVFKGADSSRRFQRAVPVMRQLASSIFRTASGEPWRWDTHRSELQTIGSYTRSCRCIIDPCQEGGLERAAMLWKAVAEVEGADRILLTVQSLLSP